MTLDYIETFLAVVEFQNISLASQKLYLSQSTVSQRIQLLEQELGVKLFVRQRGHRNVYLTSHGQEFIPIAHQWISLWRNTQQLKEHRSYQLLTIGGIDLINNFTFVPLYQKILKNYPDIYLDIRTHHSTELYSLLEKRIIDIGFVVNQKRFPDIIATPVYKEDMYLVCHPDSNYYDGISPEKLSPSNEIFLRWNSDLEAWHDRYWANHKPLMRVNTGFMLSHYLIKPDYWSIAPASCARLLKKTQNLTYYTLSSPPVPSTCYQITHRYPRESSALAIQQFSHEIFDFIHQNESLYPVEP